MMPLLHTLHTSLFARIALVFLLIMALLGGALLLVSQQMSHHYSQQVLQQLNHPVAGYVTEQRQLIDGNGLLDQASLDALSSHAMVLNPALEIYVLDHQGKILGHNLPADQVQMSHVELSPVRLYLDLYAASDANANPSSSPLIRQLPLYGNDPSLPAEQNIFSAAAIQDPEGQQTLGYVYAVIGGRLYQGLQETAFEQYAFSVGGLLMLSCVLAALLTGWLVFFAMTRRLGRLRNTMLKYDLLYPELSTLEQLPAPAPDQRKDEIDQLTLAFRQMAAHIHQQFTRLQSVDQNRRELIANVSHDLRTPLAAAQGYIETAMIKASECDTQVELQRHLQVSIRQCQRLSHLIDELFELSRLQADNTLPSLEPFSLMELAHDCLQEFQLKAAKLGIQLDIQGNQQDAYVTADIAMIQRVLQNLIDNALRHTSSGGQVRLHIKSVADGTRIEVEDTGCGISHHDIPYIFDRYYRARRTPSAAAISLSPAPQPGTSTGLGLAIVKRILDLHQSAIEVESELNKGTRFSFVLAG
jgi:signal transduction histidine kinase